MDKLIVGLGIKDVEDCSIREDRWMHDWYRMLQSCIRLKYNICLDWTRASSFRDWYYDNNKNHIGDVLGIQYMLDCNILKPNSKMYSPETCAYIPESLHSLFNAFNRFGGQYKGGSSLRVGNNKYEAKIRIGGKNKHLGFFDTEEEAQNKYRAEKYKQCKFVIDDLLINGLIDSKIRQASLNKIKILFE